MVLFIQIIVAYCSFVQNYLKNVFGKQNMNARKASPDMCTRVMSY